MFLYFVTCIGQEYSPIFIIVYLKIYSAVHVALNFCTTPYLCIWKKHIWICIHLSICICICVFGKYTPENMFLLSCRVCVFVCLEMNLYLCIWKMYSGVHVALNFLHHLLSCQALAFTAFPATLHTQCTLNNCTIKQMHTKQLQQY